MGGGVIKAKKKNLPTLKKRWELTSVEIKYVTHDANVIHDAFCVLSYDVL